MSEITSLHRCFGLRVLSKLGEQVHEWPVLTFSIWHCGPQQLYSLPSSFLSQPSRLILSPCLTSMGFTRQEYWSRLPFPSPGDLPNPGIEPRSPTLQSDALTSEPPGKPDFPEAYSYLQLTIYFTYANVSFHVTLSIHLTLSSLLPTSISLFSMSVSPLLSCK